MKNISQVVTQAPNHTETPFCYVSSASATISSLYSVYNCVRLPASLLSPHVTVCRSVSLQYLVPLAIISYSYIRVCIKLWWSVTPGKQSNSAYSVELLTNLRQSFYNNREGKIIRDTHF